MFNEFSGEQPSFNELHNARQDAADAEKYLCRIAGGPGASFHFRAIHDRDKSRHSVNLYGTFEQWWARLERLNQRGFGIFVIVNESSGTTDSSVELRPKVGDGMKG